MEREVYKEASYENRSDNAWLLTQRDPIMYALGYKKAGDVLADYMLGSGKHDMEILIYPLCFNYRHYIELSMKVIIHKGSKILGLEIEESWKNRHELDKLWKDYNCKEIIDEIVSISNGKIVIEDIDKYIMEIQKYDPKSFAFRYATDKKDKQNLLGLDYLIDVRHLCFILSKIEFALNSVMFVIEDYHNKRWTLNG